MYVTLSPGHFDRFSTPVEADTQSHVRTFKPGSYLFREGDEAKRVYHVVSGVLRLTRVTEDGRRQVIAFGFPGDIIGFPNGTKHQTECEVLRTAQVIPYRREILDSCTSNSALHLKFMQAALREISSMQDHFMMLGRKSALERVASFLCVLADRVGEPLEQYTKIDLPMCRSDIADFLGLTTETVSRTITQLRKRGLLTRVDIHTIVILKPEALLMLAEGGEDAAPHMAAAS